MPTDRIYVVGAGGHARVVLDALQAGGTDPAQLVVTDGDPAKHGARMLGVPVQCPAVGPAMAGAQFHVAIGDGALRARLHAELMALGARPLRVVHPRAVVSPHATLGEAVMIAACAVIGPGALVGDGAIVNHGAVVDHDCTVGAFAHIAPNATLGGGVTVGAGALIGAGANLLPGVSVGQQATIGAGAAVRGNVTVGQTWCGVPAKFLTRERK